MGVNQKTNGPRYTLHVLDEYSIYTIKTYIYEREPELKEFLNIYVTLIQIILKHNKKNI